MVAVAVEDELAVADTKLLCMEDCCCVVTAVPGTVAAGFCNKLEGTRDGVVTDVGCWSLPFVTFAEGDGPPVVDMEADVETWEESEDVICTSEVDSAEEVGVEAGGGRGTLLPTTVVVDVGGNWF